MRTVWKDDEMFEFCTSMAMVLEGGLSAEEGLEVVLESADKEEKKAALQEMLTLIKEKGSFSSTMMELDYIDSYAKKMMEIGEMSGTLDAVMKELAVYYERNDDLKQNLKEALTYPCILLIMMWGIVALIIWKVLPIFEQVLTSMGTVLSGNATVFMQFGNIFSLLSFLVLTILLAGCIFLFLAGRKRKGTLLASLFLTKRLYHNLTMAKMTYALSLFVSSGYDVEEALGYLPGVIDHPKMLKNLAACEKGMQEGKSFLEVMQEEKLYQGVYANMIYTGFRSGKSEEVLKKVSALYEKDVDTSISSFLNTIEPAIVIILSLIVGVILLSVMLPLMSIMTSI